VGPRAGLGAVAEIKIQSLPLREVMVDNLVIITPPHNSNQ